MSEVSSEERFEMTTLKIKKSRNRFVRLFSAVVITATLGPKPQLGSSVVKVVFS